MSGYPQIANAGHLKRPLHNAVKPSVCSRPSPMRAGRQGHRPELTEGNHPKLHKRPTQWPSAEAWGHGQWSRSKAVVALTAPGAEPLREGLRLKGAVPETENIARVLREKGGCTRGIGNTS